MRISDWSSDVCSSDLDHTLALDALGKVANTALTRDVEIEMGDSGLPNTFVPGRNIVFLTFAAALAYRRGLRHIVAGMCERSEEHTSELKSLLRSSYAGFCLKKQQV